MPWFEPINFLTQIEKSDKIIIFKGLANKCLGH